MYDRCYVEQSPVQSYFFQSKGRKIYRFNQIKLAHDYIVAFLQRKHLSSEIDKMKDNFAMVLEKIRCKFSKHLCFSFLY